MACFYFCRYLADRQRRDLAFSLLFIILAVMLKGNLLIMAVAMMIAAGVEAVRAKSWQLAAAALLVLLSAWGGKGSCFTARECYRGNI